MKTNKTPIQEFIELVSDVLNSIDESVKVSEVWDKLPQMLEKEKQFAFDCFESGHDNASRGYNLREKDHGFEKFYSKYAEQHTK